MADTSTSMDVEDVLSSIRRLVSEEAKGPAPKEKLVLSNPSAELAETPDFPEDTVAEVGENKGDTQVDIHDPLVLTPALQVVAPAKDAPDALDLALDQALADDDGPDQVDLSAGTYPTDDASLDQDFDGEDYDAEDGADDPVDVMVEAPDLDEEVDGASSAGKSLWGFAGLRNRLQKDKQPQETASRLPDDTLTVRRRTPRPAAISLEELIEETTGRAAVDGHERLRRKRKQANDPVVVPMGGATDEPMSFDDQAEVEAHEEEVEGAVSSETSLELAAAEIQITDDDKDALRAALSEHADEARPNGADPAEALSEAAADAEDEADEALDEAIFNHAEIEGADTDILAGEVVFDDPADAADAPADTASDHLENDAGDEQDTVRVDQDKDWSAVLATAMADSTQGTDGATEVTASGKSFQPVPEDIWDRAHDVALESGAEPMLNGSEAPSAAAPQAPAAPVDDMILPEGALDPRAAKPQAAPSDAEPVAQDFGAAAEIDGDFLDEEALRDMVVTILREELRGELGDRITHNVRKLVRREINRVMTAKDFE